MKKGVLRLIIAFVFILSVSMTIVIATEISEIYPIYYPVEDYWYSSSAAATISPESLGAKSTLLMEASTGKILHASNEHEKLPIASVTKIMSTLLVMEAIDEGKISYDDVVTVSKRAASMGGSQVFLEEGERMSVEDLLKALVISSANDATLALAEHICGSEDSFVARMNERAENLGMKNTRFVNTNGLDAEGHLSTAYDVALMTRELMKHQDVFKYTTIWMDTIRNGAFGLANTNKLIRFYDGATGMKTGYTKKSGFCLSATAKRDEMSLIAVVLGGESSDARFSAAKQMLDFGFANYKVLKTDPIVLDPVKVVYGKNNTARLSFDPPTILTEKGKSAVETKIEIEPTVKAPLKKGDIVGVVRYFINSVEVANVPITVDEDVEKIDFLSMLGKIWCNIANSL